MEGKPGYERPSWNEGTSKKLKRSIRSLIKRADVLIESDELKGSEVASLLRETANMVRLLDGEATEIITVRSASDASTQLTALLSGLISTIKRLPPAGQRKIWAELTGAFNKIEVTSPGDAEVVTVAYEDAPGLEISLESIPQVPPGRINPSAAPQLGQHPDYGTGGELQGQGDTQGEAPHSGAHQATAQGDSEGDSTEAGGGLTSENAS